MTHNFPPLFDVPLIEDKLADAHLIKVSFRENPMRRALQQVQDAVEIPALLRRQDEIHCGAPRPHLLLLGPDTPRMDGREFLAAIKSVPTLTNIPTILLTATDNERGAVSTDRVGASNDTTKPMNIEQFIEVVRPIEGYWFNAARLAAKAMP